MRDFTIAMFNKFTIMSTSILKSGFCQNRSRSIELMAVSNSIMTVIVSYPSLCLVISCSCSSFFFVLIFHIFKIRKVSNHTKKGEHAGVLYATRQNICPCLFNNI